MLFNDVPLSTRMALSPQTLYSDSTVLVLNGTSLNIENALLALNWQSIDSMWKQERNTLWLRESLSKAIRSDDGLNILPKGCLGLAAGKMAAPQLLAAEPEIQCFCLDISTDHLLLGRTPVLPGPACRHWWDHPLQEILETDSDSDSVWTDIEFPNISRVKDRHGLRLHVREGELRVETHTGLGELVRFCDGWGTSCSGTLGCLGVLVQEGEFVQAPVPDSLGFPGGRYRCWGQSAFPDSRTSRPSLTCPRKRWPCARCLQETADPSQTFQDQRLQS